MILRADEKLLHGVRAVLDWCEEWLGWPQREIERFLLVGSLLFIILCAAMDPHHRWFDDLADLCASYTLVRQFCRQDAIRVALLYHPYFVGVRWGLLVMVLWGVLNLSWAHRWYGTHLLNFAYVAVTSMYWWTATLPRSTPGQRRRSKKSVDLRRAFGRRLDWLPQGA